tara:strand:+ start:1848 stop:2501 length:654 start_codon:yes stop_codon:yes gene_type:complete
MEIDNPIQVYEKLKTKRNLKTNSFSSLLALKNEYMRSYRTQKVPVHTYKEYSSRIFKRNAIQPTILSHGRMWAFNYYPMGLATLPYYDFSPLVLTLSIPNKESFLGLNLHLLPPGLRIQAYYSLFPLLNTRNFDQENTRFRLIYDQLIRQERFVRLLPCIREYKTIRIRSDIHQIDPKYWDSALFNPTARFIKTNVVTAWAKTTEQIRKKIAERETL